MSSWKSYGGINNFEKRGSINADSISVNKLTLKQTYEGNFDICGHLNITGDIKVLNDVDISGALYVNKDVLFASPNSTFTVNSDSIFNGPALFNNDFATVGNIVSKENIIATKNAFVGNVLYFMNGNANATNVPFIYGNTSYMGINTMNPTAALDISTNLVRGLNIKSSNSRNENIIAQNSLGCGVSTGANVSSSNISFYADHPVSSGIADGYVSYSRGGYLNIDVSQNVNVSSQMTISTNLTNVHNHGETLSVYDISRGIYFGNIYQNNLANTGSAASFIAESNTSNTTVYVGTPSGLGGAIGGGAYPARTSRAMATIGLTDTRGNYTPGQVIVSGDPLSRYYSTTGINTFQPKIDKYVLDVNGPTHIDNGDIADATGIVPFELYSMSQAKDNAEVIAALGSSIDIFGSYTRGLPREKVIYSVNGGKNWSYIDISNEIGLPTNILKGDVLTGIHVYDSQNWFISGYKNQLITSFNGGSSWQNINTPMSDDLNFKNIYINKTPNPITGNLIGYFTDDKVQPNVYIFDISTGSFSNNIQPITSINIAFKITTIGNVSGIRADTDTVYIAGNGIATYNMKPLVQTLPAPINVWNVNRYYNEIQIFDNSYAIAVGGNIISATIDRGTTWKDTYFTGVPNFTSVHMIDSQNAITVGSQGNIWITANKGDTWSPLPLNLINSSGKASWLLSSMFRNVVMPDLNTVLITNTLQSYRFGSAQTSGVYGKSNVFSLFVPNMVNWSKNYILDISGTTRISGDLHVNDGGSIISNNESLNIANRVVKNIYLGGDATNVVIGNTVGNTTINNNMVMDGILTITNKTPSISDNLGALVVNGGAGIMGNLNVGGLASFSRDVSFNGNVAISKSTASTNFKTGALVVKGGIGVEGNLNMGGSLGIGSDLIVSGNITSKQVIITSGTILSNTGTINIPGNVNISSNLNVDGISTFMNNNRIMSETPSTNTTTGALVVAGGVGVGGTVNIGGDLIVTGSIQTPTDIGFSGSVTVHDLLIDSGEIKSGINSVQISTASKPSTGTTTGALVVDGGVGIGGNVNVGGFSSFARDASFNGNVAITRTTISNNTKTGALVVAGGVGVGGDLNIGGSLGITSDLILPGNLVAKKVTVTSGDIFSNTGTINLSNVTASTTPTTGAVTVGGGVGIVGNLNVGGDVSVGNIYCTNQFTSQSLQIAQNVDVSGSVNAARMITNEIKPTAAIFNLTPFIDTGMTINIGGPNDKIIIAGSLKAGTTDAGTQLFEPVTDAKTFTSNFTKGNGSSIGAGVDFFDNSGTNIPSIVKNIYSYMHVGKDLQSFVFKAPSYGTLAPNTIGTIDSNNPPVQLSPDNIVRLCVNELNLNDVSANVKRGLIILQSDIDYQGYQKSKGHLYGSDNIPENGVYNDANYAINICPDFDISNIMLKEFDTLSGTQTIGSNVKILGNIIGANVFVTNTLNLSGNTYFTGNVGIGSSAPLVLFDISGTSRFMGPLISTNYDTLRFSNNFGYGWKENVNTPSMISTTPKSYYQDVASSYDGKYQYALLYDEFGFGSVNKSSDAGASWTSTSLPNSYSGNIIYQAVPFMNNASSNSQTYRFEDLKGNISLPNAQPLNIQVGTYRTTASSIPGGDVPSNVFDSSTITKWQSSSTYTDSVYSGSVSTATTDSIIGGEYVQISLPYSFCLTNYEVYPFLINSNQTPAKIYVCGSNNSRTWHNLTPNGNIIQKLLNTSVSFLNSQSFNTYRFIVNTIYNPSGGGSSSTTIPRIDLNGIFQNVTGSFSSVIASSGSGQYVTVANQGYYPGTGNLYMSSDYGATFADTNQQATAVWQGVALSQTGQYQAAIGINTSGTGNIYLSKDSGRVWSPIVSLQNTVNGWQTISMSSTGQYITAIQAGNVISPKGNIWISSDYGTTWITNQQIYNYTRAVNSFLNLGTVDFNKTVCVSSSGRIQTALGLAPTSDLTANANIWISSDFGVNWTDTRSRAPSSIGTSILTSISMTGIGENQTISYVGGNTGATYPTDAVYGNILVSSNYGSSWVDNGFKVPTKTVDGNIYYGFVSKVQSTLNGQYVVGISKYADISGNTYNNNNSSATGIGNVFMSSVATSGNLLSTQYFGSSYTNGVLGTHGFKITVPTVNNASLVMGYDTNLDSAYINSGDQTGANSLGINTDGGYVGIGKINPVRTLDVSGDLLVSGEFTVGGVTNFSGKASFETMEIKSSTVSTNTTNGALVVSGGAGIRGNVNIGGNIGISNDINITSFTDNNKISIGYLSGVRSQDFRSIAIGVSAGNVQATNCIAIGYNAGQKQGVSAIAIGENAGQIEQKSNSVAIGNYAGSNNLGENSVAIGSSASAQFNNCVALGQGATCGQANQIRLGVASQTVSIPGTLSSAGIITATAFNTSSKINITSSSTTNSAISIGSPAGAVQGASSIAIGVSAGSNQSSECIAIGKSAGLTQADNCIAIGQLAGQSQGASAIAIGLGAGQNSQTSNAIAIGKASGQNSQAADGIAIGQNAGNTGQKANSVAIGINAGNSTQLANSVAIGNSAGRTNQGSQSVAIGLNAGQSGQVTDAVAIGTNAGFSGQKIQAVAIGNSAGSGTQGEYAVAIGSGTGSDTQGNGSVAIGVSSGQIRQLLNSVAIGARAGQVDLGENSIAIGIDTVCKNTNCIAIGRLANTAGFSGSVALGVNAACTANNQIRLGVAGQDVSIPGTLSVTGKITSNGGIDLGTQNITAASITASAPSTIQSNSQNAGTLIVSDKTNPRNQIMMVGNISNGGFNNITQNNDVGIIFSGVPNNSSGNFVICPWSDPPASGLSMSKSGRIGLGKFPSTTHTLDVAGSINVSSSITTQGSILLNSTTNNGTNCINFNNGTSAFNLQVNDTASPNYLRILTSSVSAFCVVPNGNIGIRNTNPSYALDIAGITNIATASITYNHSTNYTFNGTVTGLGCLNVVGTAPATVLQYDNREIMIHMHRVGLSDYNWEQYANFAMGVKNGNGGVTALDINVAYQTNGTGEYKLVKAMTITNAASTEGLVGINNGNPGAALDVVGDLRIAKNSSATREGIIRLGNSGVGTTQSGLILTSSDGNMAISNQANGTLYIGTNNTPQITVISTGVSITGNVTASGQITAPSFNAASDYRIKKDPKPLENEFSVDALKPMQYTNLLSGKKDMGFIAHEVQEIFPFLVSGEKDGKENQSLNYIGFIALLVKEVQELKKENLTLKERLDTIETVCVTKVLALLRSKE